MHLHHVIGWVMNMWYFWSPEKYSYIVVKIFLLQWCHMKVMVSQITTKFSFCSKVCLGKQQRNFNTLHYWPFVRGINCCSPHKGPEMQTFPCHDVLVIESLNHFIFSNSKITSYIKHFPLQFIHQRMVRAVLRELMTYSFIFLLEHGAKYLLDLLKLH